MKRRTVVIRAKRMGMEHDPMVVYPNDADRPRTRGDCLNGARPCPFVTCRHHLYLDVSPNGSIRINHPQIDVGDLQESCSLDVADRGTHKLVEIGKLLNVTRERVRQLEARGLRNVQKIRMLREATR